MEKLINGKRYPLWQQFVDRQNEWLGGKLVDDGDAMDRRMFGDDPNETEITGIELKPNGKESAMFYVCGKDFDCGFDVGCGGIGEQKDDNSLQFHGYGGHTFRIYKPESQKEKI